MPRKARELSPTGIYHVMLRGINQQQIFEDDEDFNVFLDILKYGKDMSGFKLYAYCLMGNHVHLLLEPCKEDLGQIFKRIGVKYAHWYNTKYKRSGHLFQDRYRSEVIKDEPHFLAALRYIHQNPVKAGMVSEPSGYKWSSYHEYIGKPCLVDTSCALDIMSMDEFVRFNNTDNNDQFIENNVLPHRMSDAAVKTIMKNKYGCQTIEDITKLSAEMRNECVKSLKAEGASIRQISRLTGISKGVVERV